VCSQANSSCHAADIADPVINAGLIWQPLLINNAFTMNKIV